MSRRIGIFGGSFDPVHNGHVTAASSFLNSGLIDSLWVLLSPAPPHKTDHNPAPFSHRMNMLRLAFEKMDGVKVTDLEANLPEPSYTLQTIEFLQKEYPDDTFFLCLGEDSVQSFDQWYKYREILEKVTLLVAERPGFNSSGLEDAVKEKTVFVDHEPLDLSSTSIRRSAGKEKSIPVPDSVAAYIGEHQLY